MNHQCKQVPLGSVRLRRRGRPSTVTRTKHPKPSVAAIVETESFKTLRDAAALTRGVGQARLLVGSKHLSVSELALQFTSDLKSRSRTRLLLRCSAGKPLALLALNGLEHARPVMAITQRWPNRAGTELQTYHPHQLQTDRM